MRELKPVKNIAEILDDETGTIHRLYYRRPTTSERVKYAGAVIGKKGEEFMQALLEIQQTMGAELLTGFEEGTFTVDGKPISSEETSKHYFPEWKDLLLTAWPQALESIAALAFRDGARMARRAKEAGEPAAPLAN